MTADRPRASLLADIGGTSIRLARDSGGRGFERVETFPCADFDGPAEAVRHYLEQGGGETPRDAALAVAATVAGDRVGMTNHPWSFSIEETRRRLGLKRLEVVNDFVAVALGVPGLGVDDRAQVGGGDARPDAPIAVIGPGTGLGQSALVPAPGGWTPVATEGGHATMAAFDDREDAVLAVLRRSFGHVSAERVVSGPGLVNLYRALAEVAGEDAVDGLEPDDIARRALDGGCPLSVQALDMFSAMLGTVAGNLALTLGAEGGVYIAGGIVPKLGPGFPESVFRRRFEEKGRFSAYVAAIPVFVITHPHPAFLGLSARLSPD